MQVAYYYMILGLQIIIYTAKKRYTSMYQYPSMYWYGCMVCSHIYAVHVHVLKVNDPYHAEEKEENCSYMATPRALFRTLSDDRNLRRFVVQARPTGRQLGTGSYGAVEEVWPRREREREMPDQ